MYCMRTQSSTKPGSPHQSSGSISPDLQISGALGPSHVLGSPITSKPTERLRAYLMFTGRSLEHRFHMRPHPLVVINRVFAHRRCSVMFTSNFLFRAANVLGTKSRRRLFFFFSGFSGESDGIVSWLSLVYLDDFSDEVSPGGFCTLATKVGRDGTEQERMRRLRVTHSVGHERLAQS